MTLTQPTGECARGLAFADTGKAAAARKQVMGHGEQLGQEAQPHAEEDVCLHPRLKHHACSPGLGRFYRKIYFCTARQQRFPNLSANTNESCPGPLCKIKYHASPLNLTLHSYYTTSNHTRYQAVAKEKPRPALLHAARVLLHKTFNRELCWASFGLNYCKKIQSQSNSWHKTAAVKEQQAFWGQ